MSKKRNKAQAFVEFAIIIPFALLALSAIIEFGYAFYTWVAIGEVARIGTRYAITGQYDPQYCPAAAAALTTAVPAWPNLAAEDLADGAADCVVSSGTDFEEKTVALQDWARILSTRDAAMNGGAIGLLFDPGVSGNYLQFLSNPSATFSDSYRGDPTAKGFISINICSNRAGVSFDLINPHYYNNLTTVNDARYLGVCVVNNKYMDDAGGPGDRIRLTVTYNHPLIIPFFQALWEHLKLSTTQDAIVERFRTSRLAGLAGGISTMAPYTPTNTSTSTSTSTFTLTPTPEPCTVPAGGNGLLARFFAFYGDETTNTWSNQVYSRIDPVVSFNWGGGSPVAGSVPGANFRVQWSGQVYPPYPGDYRFFTWSDDGVRLFIDGVQIIDKWIDQGATKYYSEIQNLNCGPHSIILQYYQGTGLSLIHLGWQNGNFGEMLPIQQQYLFSTPVPLEPTSTYQTPTLTPSITLTPSRTPTITFTPSLTFTPSRTFTPSLTFTPSNTFTRTNTYTPVPPTYTYTPSNTPLPPTYTYTPSNTPVPPNTPTASNTPLPTHTFTPRPTCGISPDAGGCTPIPP